jgi:RNA polymerase sigma factor (TIGR02999 family)
VNATSEVTRILNEARSGDDSAISRLLPLVYEELRALAGAAFRGGPADHTLQPTALVHEAYLRLVQSNAANLENKRHFMAVAATAMRQVLANHARDGKRQKRGGDWARVTLHGLQSSTVVSDLDLIALHETLEQLSALNERHARIVELRVFAGMTVEEIAQELSLSRRAVEMNWRSARAWLREALDSHDSDQ